MTLKELLAKKAEIQTQMDASVEPLRDQIKAISAPYLDEISDINMAINDLVLPNLTTMRDLSGKEFGVIHVNIDGVKVSQTISKTVAWDQDVMLDIFKRIQAAGDDPFNYVKVKIEVPEKSYNDFPKPIRNVFNEARTVKPGAPSIKFETFE